MPDTPTVVEPTTAPRNRAQRRHPETIPSTVPKLALTIDEACQALTVSRWTINELIAQGRIRTVKAGRRRLVPITELERLLAEND